MKSHPVVLHGGSIELCEMPESQVAPGEKMEAGDRRTMAADMVHPGVGHIRSGLIKYTNIIL